MSRREMIHEACRLIRLKMREQDVPIHIPSQKEYRETIEIVISWKFVN
jgi:hypothetical protein